MSENSSGVTLSDKKRCLLPNFEHTFGGPVSRLAVWPFEMNKTSPFGSVSVT